MPFLHLLRGLVQGLLAGRPQAVFAAALLRSRGKSTASVADFD
jgi:hypothetical protein